MSEAINAFELAEQVRREHNGIMSVHLFLGHDGHNVCILEDYNGEVGKGESGRTLSEAINKALSNFRYRELTSGVVAGREAVEVAISDAIKLFGGGDIFNTASFQVSINSARRFRLMDADVINLLCNHRQIVRLAGGEHWLRLPHQIYRYASPAEAERGHADDSERESLPSSP
jgi:hypothetical protein